MMKLLALSTAVLLVTGVSGPAFATAASSETAPAEQAGSETLKAAEETTKAGGDTVATPSAATPEPSAKQTPTQAGQGAHTTDGKPVAKEEASSSHGGTLHPEEPPQMEWSFEGPMGTYDRAALQRGFQIYKQVCATCHSMKRVYYRNLSALGYSEAQIKAIASEYTVTDGPNDEGEMFDRPGRPSDHFKSPFANDNAAKYSNGGALPPDLSLIIKAREDGPNYVHAILTGYEPSKEGTPPGQYTNKYREGHTIAMPPPLSEGMITYDDGTTGTVEQYSKDVVQFLTWAAEPEMEVRKQTGIKVLFYLIVFAGLMYAVKRKIWSKIH